MTLQEINTVLNLASLIVNNKDVRIGMSTVLEMNVVVNVLLSVKHAEELDIDYGSLTIRSVI